MRTRRLVARAMALGLLLGASAAGAAHVARCELTGTVDSGSAAYLRDCVARSENTGAAALLVRVDTPGGSLEATRQMVSSFLGARVPVLAWVGPSGARAGSAGLFVVLASHLAAMAPGTNIGAAHPVEALTGANPGGGENEELARKVENDAVAFAESVAKQRGRNTAWVEEAVRKSASVPSDRAVELKVVDFLATSEEEVLAKAEGRTVSLPSRGTATLSLSGVERIDFHPTMGQSVVHALANPSIAYLLFVLGALGLMFELSHPGAIAPGFMGVTCLVLGLVAMSALPIRAGAVAVLVLGVALMAAELWAGHGLFAAAGVLLLALGGVLLVDRANQRWFVEPSFGVGLAFILPIALLLGSAAAFVAIRGAQARRLPQRGGDAGLVGEEGRTLTAVGPSGGEVFVHGERWSAFSQENIPPSAPVVVLAVRGLTVQVKEI